MTKKELIEENEALKAKLAKIESKIGRHLKGLFGL